MCWVDAKMHFLIDAFVDPPIQTMPRFILRFINVSNASDVVVLLSFSGIFHLLCSCFVNLGVGLGVILPVAGSILTFRCLWPTVGQCGGLLAALCPPGLPRKGQSRRCEQKGGSWVHPWTPQEHPKSIKINKIVKVCLCVGVGMHFLCPRCRQVGAGYAQATISTMVLEAFQVLGV